MVELLAEFTPRQAIPARDGDLWVSLTFITHGLDHGALQGERNLAGHVQTVGVQEDQPSFRELFMSSGPHVRLTGGSAVFLTEKLELPLHRGDSLSICVSQDTADDEAINPFFTGDASRALVGWV
jgi:hypothetical protein